MTPTDFKRLPGIEAHHEKLLRRLHKLELPLEPASLLSMDPQAFGQTPGVGQLYVETLEDLQRLLRDPELRAQLRSSTERTEGEVDLESLRNIARDEQLSIRASGLPKEESKALEKLARNGVDSYQVEALLRLTPKNFEAQAGFGRKSVSALANLQKRVVRELQTYDRPPGRVPQNRLFAVGADEDYSAAELDSLLLEDLDDLLLAQRDRERLIFMHRFAFGVPRLTLEELGQALGVTRERVRQLEACVVRDLARSFRVSNEVLARNLVQLAENESLLTLLPTLSGCFTKRSAFFEFLGTIADGHDFASREGVGVNYPVKIVEPFFAMIGRPATKSEIVDYLVGEEGLAEGNAVGAVRALAESGALEETENGLKPTRLRQKAALGYILANAFEPLHWSEMVKRFNAAKVSRSVLDETRVPPPVQTSEYVYLAEKGTYWHVQYIDTNEIDERRVAQICLQHLNELGQDSAALYPIYQARREELGIDDYFVFRHVVRSFEGEYSLYFDGRSSADTVSRVEDVQRVTLAESLVRMLDAQAEPMTIEELAERTRTGNTQLVQLNIGRLLAENRIVRASQGAYQSTGSALDEIDVERVVEKTRKLLVSDERLWDMSPLTDLLNAEFALEKTYHWWTGVLGALCEDGGWHQEQTLIGFATPPSNGLRGVLIELGWDKPQSQLLSELQHRVHTSEKTLTRAKRFLYVNNHGKM